MQERRASFLKAEYNHFVVSFLSPVPRLLSPAMEYLCLTLLANPGESEAAFRSRLTAFWTHLLRTQPNTYTAVYAEAKAFEKTNDRVSRAYMVQVDAVEAVADALEQNGVTALPLDHHDTYSKYEASGSEWFQIPH